MKTLHRLYISPLPIDQAPRERASRFLGIPGILKIENSYRVDRDILKNLVLESDDDIDEGSLSRYVAEPGFHQIHLILTGDQWAELGLRPTLYGQARTVGGQVITYGAWDDRRGILDHYSKEIQANFTENTLGEWHEGRHGLGPMLGIMNPTTHAAFYGYRASDSHLSKSRRWVRKPYPLEDWRALPWHLLPDRQPPRVKVEKKLAETRFNVLAFVGQLLDNMSRRLNTKPTLFAAANEYLGREASPRDLAPDELACAESVTNIIKDVLPDFPVITGTWTLWDALENDSRFKRVASPMPGTIIISPTGTVKDAKIVGHTGIFARDLIIMSNTSANGLWEENYTLDSWNARYRAAGYPVYYYQLTQ